MHLLAAADDAARGGRSTPFLQRYRCRGIRSGQITRYLHSCRCSQRKWGLDPDHEFCWANKVGLSTMPVTTTTMLFVNLLTLFRCYRTEGRSLLTHLDKNHFPSCLCKLHCSFFCFLTTSTDTPEKSILCVSYQWLLSQRRPTANKKRNERTQDRCVWLVRWPWILRWWYIIYVYRRDVIRYTTYFSSPINNMTPSTTPWMVWYIP